MTSVMLSKIRMSNALQYAFLPQIGPRLNEFISQGFSNLAYLMLIIYQSVNLIPKNHFFSQKENHGKYTIRQVMAEAARNLKFDKKHIDQVIIFFALIAGMLILLLQFLFMLSFMMIDPAFAQDGMPTSYGGFLETTGNTEDIALKILSYVFGLPDFWGQGLPAETDFHKALRGIFQIYSIGLLVIAAIIIIYFIFAILAETAQTGTPFGKRYNHVWAPIRLVVAIGLLIPISEGLNSGQWITLYAAKFGSGFATNGWNKFNEKLNDTYIPKEETIAKPNIQEKDFKDLAAFFMIAHGCKAAYDIQDPESSGEDTNRPPIQAWLIKKEDGGGATLFTGSYVEAMQFAKSKTLRIRIGAQDTTKYKEHTGNVYPHCGELSILLAEDGVFTDEDGNTSSNLGFSQINQAYFDIINEMYFGMGPYAVLKEEAEELVKERLERNSEVAQISADIKPNVLKPAKQKVEQEMERAIQYVINSFEQSEEKDYEKYGWGGGGIFYNTIASKNGELVNAALNKPQITSMPKRMEYVCRQNRQQNNKTSTKNCYDPHLAGGKKLQLTGTINTPAIKALSDIHSFWYKDPEEITGNAVIDTINVILGTTSLFNMCKNVDIHPLAQLSVLGKGLVDASIRNLGFGIAGGIGSMLAGVFGPALSAASGFATSIGSISILMGFILYYIVPFMPFLYFLFAVGGWVKGLFEAMVGIPLWALAHIRIDGEGLPGDAAANGYFLIFEIFIRPILIVFGLLASLLIFSAMVKVLNEVFHLAVSNLSGFDPASKTLCGKELVGGSTPPVGSIDYFRGPVDEFFFTIVYAIMVYMIGMSSFKLIDMIPNQILRWMGASVPTFNDQAGEPADGLIQKMAIGGGMLSQVAGGVGGNLQKAVGSGAKGVSDVVSKK